MDIDFRGVSYKYGLWGHVLSEIDLHIPLEVRPALLVYLAQETTLVKMMAHFYAPNQGDICLEESTSISWINRHCATYQPSSQQPYVFTGPWVLLLLGAHEGTTVVIFCGTVEYKLGSDIERMPSIIRQSWFADGAGIFAVNVAYCAQRALLT